MDNIATFSSSAAIVSRLGDELIRDPHTAFFELIKNAYDADATEVYVRFRKTTADDGMITIQDNGSGMSLDDLKAKWARAAGENKLREPYTPRFNRRRLGAKGIGRFSAAKLGSRLKVTTRVANRPSQLVFRIDFRDFTDDRDFGEMQIPYSEGVPKTDFASGTIIDIVGLHAKWGKRDVRKVYDQLCHLIDPERKDQRFSVRFDCPEWPELSGLLKNPISGTESHVLRFSIDRSGRYESELRVLQKSTKKSEKRDSPRFGPVEGVIRYYKEGLKARERLLTEGTDESHMGVKVYRDGCRVRPYGEPSDDWLEVKGRRARGGGKYYIHPQTLAGSIYISAADNPRLKDATNREAGIIETEEFIEFREFVRQHIEVLNDVLDQETKSEAQRQKRHTVKRILDTIVGCLNRQESDVYQGYVEKIDREKRGLEGKTSDPLGDRVIDLVTPTKDEWHCIDCDARWRVLRGQIPSRCMELAVNRQGHPRRVQGCGSKNIERAKHEMDNLGTELSSVISGQYALVAGRQVRVRVDYELGQHEDEFHVDEREIVINGNHLGYTLAERLDGMSGRKYEIGDAVFVPALTIQIAKCVCLAWGELHFHQTKSWTEFKDRYDSLLSSICESVQGELPPAKSPSG